MKRSIVLFLLLTILVFNSSTSYGDMLFLDVGEDYWAYDYINKVIDLGLMDGYEDGTFKPNDVVNVADALVYIVRLMNIEKEEVDSIREYYDSLLNYNQLTEEQKVAIAIALKRGFIDEEFIQQQLFDEEGIKKSTKLEISKYIAKAMGFKEEDYDKSLIFSYNDAKDIPESEKPYVKFLIDEGILDKKGDENRNFNPYQNVTRAILAKMLSKAYDSINGKSIIEVEKIIDPTDNQNEITDTVEEVKYEEMSGTILMIIRNYIIVDTGEKVESYMITENTEIVVNDESSSIENLLPEMDVKLIVSENKSIEKIEVKDDSSMEYWTIDEIYLGQNPYMVVKDEDGDVKTFDLSGEPKVVLNGKNSHLFSLDEGDKVRVEGIDSVALSIYGESKDGKVIGKLKDVSIGEELFIFVEREDGSVFQYKVNSEAEVNRDLSRAEISDLRYPDELILTIRDGEVYGIEAYSYQSQDRGYIRKILIADESILTIERLDGTVVEYPISRKAMISKDDINLDIYDLRLGDFVELDLKSYEIVNLKAGNIVKEN